MINIFNHSLEFFITHKLVYIADSVRHSFIKAKASGSSFNQISGFKLAFFERIFRSIHFDCSLPFNSTAFSRKADFIRT